MSHYNVQSMPFSQAPGCPTIDLRVGDVVIDCLVGPKGVNAKATVVEIWKEDQKDFSIFGLKLSTTHLEGLRHPWEIRLVEAFDKAVF